jgi:hypothetical protein
MKKEHPYPFLCTPRLPYLCHVLGPPKVNQFYLLFSPAPSSKFSIFQLKQLEARERGPVGLP